MGILDLNKENDDDELYYQQKEREMQEEVFIGTFSGKIREKLFEIGKKENKSVDAKMLRLGRVEFYFGDDLCAMQNHYESGGYIKHYTNMLDLQKPWWKKSFLEHACKGSLENIGLISPSVLEVISFAGSEDVSSKFNIENILNKLGIKNVNENAILNGEFTDHEMYSDRSDQTIQILIDKMVEFWKKLAAPNFDVEFSNGGGDILSKIRLIPLNPAAQDSIMKGGKILDDVAKKIVDGYDDLIAELKQG